MSGHGNHHHMNHGSHDHMAHTSTTINDTVPTVMTTASTVLESLLTTAMTHGMRHVNKNASVSSKHIHDIGQTSDMTSTEHYHITDEHDSTNLHNHGGSNGHMMMYFNTGVDVTILFKDWEVSTVGGLIGSIIGIFLLAMLYEGLKFFREYLFKQYFSSLQYTTVSVTGQDGKTLTEIHKVARNRMMSWPHGVQTFLHVIQMVISYFLMLIFMTYNVWLCIAVALGAGAGYFLFGWRKATVVDVTEHCH